MEATLAILTISGKKYTAPVERTDGELKFEIPVSGVVESIDLIIEVQTPEWIEPLFDYGPKELG